MFLHVSMMVMLIRSAVALAALTEVNRSFRVFCYIQTCCYFLRLLRVTVLSKKFEETTDQTEHWYGTKYRMKKIPDDVIQVELNFEKHSLYVFLNALYHHKLVDSTMSLSWGMSCRGHVSPMSRNRRSLVRGHNHLGNTGRRPDALVFFHIREAFRCS